MEFFCLRVQIPVFLGTSPLLSQNSNQPFPTCSNLAANSGTLSLSWAERAELLSWLRTINDFWERGVGGSRAIGTVPQQLSTWLVCETRSLISLELTVYARLAGQLAPGTHMTPPPQSWSYKFRPPCPFYFMVSGERMQVLKIVYKPVTMQTTYLPPTSRLPFFFGFYFFFSFLLLSHSISQSLHLCSHWSFPAPFFCLLLSL